MDLVPSNVEGTQVSMLKLCFHSPTSEEVEEIVERLFKIKGWSFPSLLELAKGLNETVAGPVTSADDGMLAGEATGKQQAWHIIFCYNGQTTQLMLPPMTGDWLHVAISYVEGHTEIGCSWDGAPPRKVEADYSKMDQRVSVDGYVGLEVTRKKVMNNLLCDIHYFRAWKSSPGVDKVMARHSDAEAPDPILAAGDTIYTMTVAACIHEDRGYVLDLI
eukprot:symbB.v1.2.037717.t1/scaffold5647.1/size24966/1